MFQDAAAACARWLKSDPSADKTHYILVQKVAAGQEAEAKRVADPEAEIEFLGQEKRQKKQPRNRHRENDAFGVLCGDGEVVVFGKGKRQRQDRDQRQRGDKTRHFRFSARQP